MQTAYPGGLGAPLAVVTLSNPVAASVIGVALLGERLQGGVVGILLCGGALAAARAQRRSVLTRSPRLHLAADVPVPDLVAALPGQAVEPPTLHLSRS
ncbi:Integral membrane protein OS=Streptomyces alboniger OX=132473 GN=CP975_30810 PE=4 SV=1 [Streptomyces alboniger]